MIEKIIEIQNIGTFSPCTAQGDVSFRRMTLIYAPNGRGKTTLCDIFRSLASANSDLIAGRTTLGTAGNPTVHFRVAGRSVRYSNGAWSVQHPDLLVYDSKFVSDNVFAGDHVGLDQKRSLCGIIIGEKGAEIRARIEELDGETRSAQQEITRHENQLRRDTPSSISLQDFLALEADDDIDAAIAAKERELEAIQGAEEVAAEAGLTTVDVPRAPTGLDDHLRQTVSDLVEEAIAEVHQHIEHNMLEPDEEWLRRGSELRTPSSCPFCGSEVGELDILSAYEGYFTEAYQDLVARSAELEAEIEGFMSEADMLRMSQTVEANTERCAYWNDYVEVTIPANPVPALEAAAALVRTSTLALLASKQQRPLEAIEPDESMADARVAFTAAVSSGDDYNAAMVTSNRAIDEKKEELLAADRESVASELALLKAQKLRHDDEMARRCSELEAARATKAAFEEEKRVEKEALDRHCASVFGRYEEGINGLLTRFRAGFRLVDTGYNYSGGKPTSTYSLQINEEPVSLGDSGTPVRQPSFKNTLSTGDRNALALSFFLTRLQEDPDIGSKAVVLDDPFTSLDWTRREWTKQEICRVARAAGQVIVLSHDPRFLRAIARDLPAGDVRALRFHRSGGATTVIEWDSEQEIREFYFADHAKLREYRDAGTGEPRSVAMCIRTMLERYLRIKLPTCFGPTDWLGEMVTKIRDAPLGSQAAEAQSILPDLTALKDYSKRYHHGSNPDADTEIVEETELAGFADLALTIVGRF